MPGWHEATLDRQKQGDFQMIGIIQEQHPDRTALFMQWKQMGWPILVDSLNLLGTAVVPRTLLIDEHGIVRATRARPEQLDAFLAESFEAPGPSRQPGSSRAGATGSVDRLFLEHGESRIDEVISGYEQIVGANPDSGALHFRLGVAYRVRYDSEGRREGDFRRAVEAWKRALDLDPNQYIWRRRIQQYGPRLDKPYPFYDWVHQARDQITARGETPVVLTIEPRGAEFAAPAREFVVKASGKEEPDARGRIHRDDGLIRLESLLVPDTSAEQRAARVHLTLNPNPERLAHWNNEVEDLVVWVNPPEGWQTDRRYLTVASAAEPVSTEERSVEFEVRRISDGQPTALTGYALYYVCEDVDGTCLYRRQDFELELPKR